MNPLIQFKGVKKQYGKKLVFENINLDIYDGEIFGIIGMSGSGKTTLMNTLIGFLEPEEGDVLYYDKGKKIYQSVFKNVFEVRKKFGFATQEPSFYPKLTIGENLEHFGTLYKLPKHIIKHNTISLLEMVGLDAEKDQLAQELSGGMEKRLGIACSLIHNPEVLILDEPTANLDPVLREHTWDVIKNIHKATGTTVIVASHLLEEMEPICSRIGILHKHALVEVGTPNQLKGRYTQNEEIVLEVSQNHEQICRIMRKSDYVDKIKQKDNSLIFYTPEPEKALYQILHLIEKMGEKIISLEVSKPSLKEVFESIYYK